MTDARQRTQRTDDAVAAERSHRTLSGEPVPEIATAEDLASWDPDERLGRPGEFPFTRGVYPSMYRGRLWTMRQFAGFGTPAETNARYRFLLAQGQGGLSVAFDMPTLMGLDSDDPRSEGEVGRCGVATDSLDDFETLFDSIPLGRHQHVDDDQRTGHRGVRVLPGHGGAPGGGVGSARRHAADRHPQGVHRAEGMDLPAASAPAADRRPHGLLCRAVPQVPSGERERLPHPRGRSDGGPGAGVHAGRRVRLRRTRAAPRARRGSLLLRACRSSSTATSTSSKRSRSSGPLGASGRGGCAIDTAPPIPPRCVCGSTRRPPGSPTPRSNR